MDSKVLVDLTEAYVAVYDEDLRYDLQELNELGSELSFINELNDNELDFVVENVIYEMVDEGYEIDEIEDLFESSMEEYEYLYEELYEKLHEGKASELVRRGEEIKRRSKNIAGIRFRRSFGRAASHAAERAKTYAGGVSSAVQGGIAQAGRSARSAASSAQKAVSGKLKSAGEKVKGFIGRAATDIQTAPGIISRGAQRAGANLTNRAARYGAGLARKAADRLDKTAHRAYLRKYVLDTPHPSKGGSRVPTRRPSSSGSTSSSTSSSAPTSRTGPASASRGKFSSKNTLGLAARKAYKDTDSAIRGAARRSASSAPTPTTGSGSTQSGSSSFSGKSTHGRAARAAYREMQSAGRRVRTRALPPAGGSGGTIPAGRFGAGGLRSDTARNKYNKSRGMPHPTTTAEDIELLLPYIIEDLIYEGYADSVNEVYDILESLSDYDFDNLVESYLDAEVETYDYYDAVMDYLLDEGFAEDEEDAEVIMANMSDEWRDTILEYSNEVDTKTGRYVDPEHPENVAAAEERRKRRAKRGPLTFTDNSRSTDQGRTGRRPSRWH